MRLIVPSFLIVLALTGLAGCATPPPADDPDAVAEYKDNNDPLEPTNRVFYAINDALDTVILRPIALGYRYGTPQPVQTGVHNVLTNLGTPMVLANDMLQGKPRRAGDTFMRMVVNTTLGVGGLFDFATGMGWPGHDNDFGITLAIWGTPSGMFLYLPVLGPSNPRDGIAFGVETYGDPLGYVGKGQDVRNLRLVRTGMGAVDARSRVLDDFDKVKAQAFDPYATIRSLSQQYRKQKINDVIEDTRASAPWPAANKTP